MNELRKLIDDLRGELKDSRACFKYAGVNDGEANAYFHYVVPLENQKGDYYKLIFADESQYNRSTNTYEHPKYWGSLTIEKDSEEEYTVEYWEPQMNMNDCQLTADELEDVLLTALPDGVLPSNHEVMYKDYYYLMMNN